mgnify:FL=1
MEINEIRTIFLKYWDPILIGDNELLIDEYDNYVNSMFDYLKGDNIDDIVDLLILFENEMGVETDLYTKRNVASKLIK